jgi:hypothetical protein
VTAEPRWESVDDTTADLLHLVAEGSLALGTGGEWETYLVGLHRASQPDGRLSLNDLRTCITDVAPQRRGAFMGAAKKAGLLEEDGCDINDDSESGNAGKPQRTYKLTLHGQAVVVAAWRKRVTA